MSDRIAVVNQGRIVQCDAPAQLYRRPRTRFVASFFRGCNVLNAVLIGQADGSASFEIAGTAIEGVPLDGALRAGTHVAVRAENVLVGPQAESSPARLPAALVETVYRGTVQDYLLRLQDGQQLVATTTRQIGVPPGSTVTIGFEPDAVIPLED